MIAALYVDPRGCYADLVDVDPWCAVRDARLYPGPHPAVAHPPCQRWGRFWHGSTRKPHQFQMGDDGGCFAAALAAVRRFGGVIEHPAQSHAWDKKFFDLKRPPHGGGWVEADAHGGWTCHVEQGHYGHFSRKPTWLYAVGCDRPDLIWGPGEQRLHPVALAKHGYEKARRIGMAAMIGGKDKTRTREATPLPFRDLLVSIARTVNMTKQHPVEGDVKREIRKLLDQHGWFTWMPPANTFGTTGQSDHLAIRKGIFLAVEAKLKKDKGSATQETFLAKVRAQGGIAVVVNQARLPKFALMLERISAAYP